MKAGREELTDSGRAVRGRFRAFVLSMAAPFLLVGCASSGSPYDSMGADELWEAGMEAFEEEDWTKAIDLFDRMIDVNAAHPNAPDARLNKARSHEENGEYILAIGEYQIFLDVYFSNPRAPEASLGICRSYVELSPIPQRDQSDTERARDACGRTAVEFRGLTVAEEAEAYRKQMVDRLGERAYQDAEFYWKRGQLLSAADLFESVAATHWDTPWAPAAILARYRIFQELEWTEEADEEVLRLEYNYPESPEASLLREELGATGADSAEP